MNQSQGRHEKEQIWRERVAKASEYSGSTREFCQKEGLSVNTFQYWKQKFAREMEGLAPKTHPFVKVEVENLRTETKHESQLPDPRWVAEFLIHLQRGLQ